MRGYHRPRRWGGQAVNANRHDATLRSTVSDIMVGQVGYFTHGQVQQRWDHGRPRSSTTDFAKSRGTAQRTGIVGGRVRQGREYRSTRDARGADRCRTRVGSSVRRLQPLCHPEGALLRHQRRAARTRARAAPCARGATGKPCGSHRRKSSRGTASTNSGDRRPNSANTRRSRLLTMAS